MKDKYKKFYMMFDKRFKNLILCSNLNCDGRVISNSDLKRCNYGNKHMGNGGVCVRTNSTFANFKINKQTKRKRNSRGQLQGRLMHGIVFSFMKPNVFFRIGGMALTFTGFIGLITLSVIHLFYEDGVV